jgi:hypothetical protein
MEQVFARIDDHTRLSSHMSESSWMMGGSRMKVEVDAGLGQKVGSRIRLAGRALGIDLSVDEVVTERNPPFRKVWETTGSPRLLMIGHYRVGVDLSPRGVESVLRVFIDYTLPESGPAHWLGRLFGRYYARVYTADGRRRGKTFHVVRIGYSAACRRQEQSVSVAAQFSRKRSFTLVLFRWEAREVKWPRPKICQPPRSRDSSPRFPAPSSNACRSSASIRSCAH